MASDYYVNRPGILVVDDDDAIRGMLELSLQESGFAVWFAANGQEAVDVYLRHRDDIALVLSDVQMPDVDGPQMLVRLRETNPRIRCCFMSGGTGRYGKNELLEMGAERIFEKPLDLAEVVGFLLASARP